MSKVIEVQQEKCTACLRCELECAMVNSGLFAPSAARIKVALFDRDQFYLPVVCQQCEEPYCREICPAGAIDRNEAGAWAINADRCVSCRMCIMACPFGGLNFSPLEKKVVKCDLCHGDPQCVKACIFGALEYKEAADAAGDKIRRAALRTKTVLSEVG